MFRANSRAKERDYCPPVWPGDLAKSYKNSDLLRRGLVAITAGVATIALIGCGDSQRSKATAATPYCLGDTVGNSQFGAASTRYTELGIANELYKNLAGVGGLDAAIIKITPAQDDRSYTDRRVHVYPGDYVEVCFETAQQYELADPREHPSQG